MPTDGWPYMRNSCNQDHMIHELTNIAIDGMAPRAFSCDKLITPWGTTTP
jgi:hypothetical protein